MCFQNCYAVVCTDTKGPTGTDKVTRDVKFPKVCPPRLEC